MGQVVQTLTSGSSWTVPSGVTSVEAECWAGGGKGGELSANGGGGGGGGGAYSKRAFTGLTPGGSISYSIGAGATTTSNGGDTWWSSNDSSGAVAKGGVSTANNTTTGSAGGAAGSGFGTTKFSGGRGVDGLASTYGGGGGGSAGSAADGNTGSTSTGGVAVTDGGVGGNGKASPQGNGSAPASGVGGGGGGGLRTSSGTRTGGSGANGQIKLTYTAIDISALDDDFAAGSLDTVKWTNTSEANTSSTQANNRLEITGPTSALTGYASITSVGTYDLTNNGAYSSCSQLGFQGSANCDTTTLQLSLDSSNSLIWFVATGQLFARKRVAAANTNVFQVAYDAAAHRWFRIRHLTSDGKVYFDTAPSTASDPPASGDWVNRWSEAAPITITALKVVFANGAFAAAGTNVGTSYVDSVNSATVNRIPQPVNVSQAVMRSASY